MKMTKTLQHSKLKNKVLIDQLLISFWSTGLFTH